MTRVDWIVVVLRVYGVYLVINGLLAFPDVLTMSRTMAGTDDNGLVPMQGAKIVMTLIVGIILFKMAPGVAALGEPRAEKAPPAIE